MERTNEFCEADEREKGMVKVRGSKWFEGWLGGDCGSKYQKENKGGC